MAKAKKPSKRGITWVHQDGKSVELPWKTYGEARAVVKDLCDQAEFDIAEHERKYRIPAPHLRKRIADARKGLNHLVKALKGCR